MGVNNSRVGDDSLPAYRCLWLGVLTGRPDNSDEATAGDAAVGNTETPTETDTPADGGETAEETDSPTQTQVPYSDRTASVLLQSNVFAAASIVSLRWANLPSIRMRRLSAMAVREHEPRKPRFFGFLN